MDPFTRLFDVAGQTPAAHFPTLSRGVVDSLILTAVFLLAGQVSLGIPILGLLMPLPLVILVLFVCLLVSGTYSVRRQADYLSMFLRTLLAFGVAIVPVLTIVCLAVPGEQDVLFGVFFLFMAFIVMNTVQPLITAGEQRLAREAPARPADHQA